ncbi:hypothetical protein HY480_05140 [Candidatus Uhrbacteria bacterium]|nr:hypothetical protein [Candidatus Uhrbacteria bacterium]
MTILKFLRLFVVDAQVWTWRLIMRVVYGAPFPDTRFRVDLDNPESDRAFVALPMDELGRRYMEQPPGSGIRMYVYDLRPQLRILRDLERTSPLGPR